MLASGKSLVQPLSRGAPPHGVVVSLLPNRRISYSNFSKFSSSLFKIPSKPSLPMSRLKVCSCLRLIPNVVMETSSLMIKEINSLIPRQIRLFLKVIVAIGLFRVVIELIRRINGWDFLDVNDLITTQVGGVKLLGFVESKGWFGITIKLKDGNRVYISKGKSNGVINKFDHQIINGEDVNWRFTTELEIGMDHVESIKKEVYKILEEDKDLEQEDAFVVVHHFDFVNRIAVLLVSCFTKAATHEDYFTIREALLLKLRKLITTGQVYGRIVSSIS